MSEAHDDFTPWTAEGAQRLASAGKRLADAIATHSEAVASARGRRDLRMLFSAGEALLSALLAYADAQFDYTGATFPLGVLHQLADEGDDKDDDEDGDDERAETRPASGISILRRHDFGVVDEAAVLAAGRAAYLRVWPDDHAEDAAADVADLGRALYQVAHADGWDSLGRVEGLRPLGGLTHVVDQRELLSADPEDSPRDAFITDGEVIYQHADVWE